MLLAGMLVEFDGIAGTRRMRAFLSSSFERETFSLQLSAPEVAEHFLLVDIIAVASPASGEALIAHISEGEFC